MFKPIAGSAGEAGVTLTLDGLPVRATPGESVAAVLLRHAPYRARTSTLSGEPRAPYCLMGVCFDCLVEIDGDASVQSCLVTVREGMTVARQDGRRRAR